MEPEKMTLTELSAALESKEIGAKELVENSLQRAEVCLEKTGSFIDLDRDEALASAEASDRRRNQGEALSPLDGIPLGIKDNILIAGREANSGSEILKGYRSAYDATVITRLRQAGCSFIGRTNMDEFAMGSSTETSAHGPTKNPWDLERIPGGSSGGSAAAVAEGSVPAALGSDTGGSVRQPAAMCGVVGMKPTYGRVSRYGLMIMASSLDQIGPLTRSAEDAATILKAIEGYDRNDSNSVPLKPEWALPEKWPEDLKGKRIGLPTEYFSQELDAKVSEPVKKAIEQLKRLGAEPVEVSLPHAKYALSVYYVLMPAEVSANLSRYDGIRYGNRQEGEGLWQTYSQTRGQGFGPEVRRRIMIGAYALSSGYYDAYYRKSLQVRRLIAEDFRKAYEKCDLIVTPTTPMPAWKLGEKVEDPISMYLADIYTVSVNVAGLPAVSLPCGLADGLPVGLQIIGRHFEDGQVLAAARAYEQARGEFARPNTDWLAA